MIVSIVIRVGDTSLDLESNMWKLGKATRSKEIQTSIMVNPSRTFLRLYHHEA